MKHEIIIHGYQVPEDRREQFNAQYGIGPHDPRVPFEDRVFPISVVTGESDPEKVKARLLGKLPIEDQLYRKIDDDEFRGNEYFEAEHGSSEELVVEKRPPAPGFICRPGDRYILKDIGAGEYVMVGCRHPDWPVGLWGIPHNKTYEYRLHRSQIKNITPRLAAK
jgi:hypothetical protein